MSEDDHTKAPTTIREVGIHIGYMRDAQKQTQGDINEVKKLIEDIKVGQVSPATVAALDVRVTKLETFVDGIKTRIAGWAVTIFVAMVLALYGLDKWFKG